MSSPSDHHKQQQQAAWRRRTTTTTHDAAAALYDEMSHAAATHTSRSASPELQQAFSSSPLPCRGNSGEGPSTSSPPSSALSLFVPVTSATLAPPAPSSVSSASNSFHVANGTTGAATASGGSLFYVRRLSVSPGNGARGGVRHLSVVSSAHTSRHTANSSVTALPMKVADSESSSVNIGRNSPESVTPAVQPTQPHAAAGSAFSMNTLSNPSGSIHSLTSPFSFIRGGASGSAPPSATTATSNAAPVYIRHLSSAFSATAPWFRLHSFDSNASPTSTISAGAATATMAIANSNSSNLGGCPGPPGQPSAISRSTSGAAAAAAVTTNAAGASSADTPKAGNALSSPTPGTPPAVLDPHHSPGSEDEAAPACHMCQSLKCVCGRGGGAGEGGSTRLSSCYGRGASADGGCMARTAAVAHQQQHPPHLVGCPTAVANSMAPLSLVPPFRTARVESGVYRGAYPVLRNFPYLRQLRLSTIVSLIPEPPTYDLKCFAEAEHIQLHHIHAERAKGEVQLLPSELSEALQLIMNADLHPLYVHCLDGRHVTGLVMMGIRKLQQWDITAAHAEYLRFTGEEQDEVSFIADYTGPLLVPPHIPPWLWGGSLYDPVSGQPKKLQPSTMRLRLSTTVTSGAASPYASSPNSAILNASGAPSSPRATAAAMAAAVSRSSTSADGPPTMRSGGNDVANTVVGRGGNVRSHAAAPWMSVPNAEIVASDGQLYVDVDRVSGAAALYSSTNVPSYDSVPMLFSFGDAAARSGSPSRNGDGGGRGITAAHRGAHQRTTGPHSASATAPLRIPGTINVHSRVLAAASVSRPSSQSNSTNGSMTSPPATALAALVAAAVRGNSTNTRSSSPSSKWATTAPLDTPQPQPQPGLYHMQPPSPTSSAAPNTTGTTGVAAIQPAQQMQRASPTPSSGSNNANATVSSSSLFDNQLSALMWTSGLITPPTGPSLRKIPVAASVGAAATSAGENGVSGGVSAGGVSIDGVTGVGGVGSGAEAASSSRRATGAGVNAAGSSASSRAAKRSFSR
ncbi:tyrosine phospatase-like protein [Leptomonas seymouri]|uniref:Tyrosine phospatase-like protein n=1 Tax=Leptomonas seymouri TaxID=5684 RepID=A0A0N0P2R1_LEPSE|nr:tyrosine phospatase-like protein [Leptomonas seymouri]|eukprot:KPI83249.1 tyrosine phospatase-like protein [Leptomonas seymouri]